MAFPWLALAPEAEDGDEHSALQPLQLALAVVLPLLFFPLEAMSLAILRSVGVDLVSRNGPQRRQLAGGWLLACGLALLAQVRLSLISLSSLTAAASVVMAILYSHVYGVSEKVRVLVGCVVAAVAIEHSSLKPSDTVLCGLLAELACSCLGSWVHRHSARLIGAERMLPPAATTAAAAPDAAAAAAAAAAVAIRSFSTSANARAACGRGSCGGNARAACAAATAAAAAVASSDDAASSDWAAASDDAASSGGYPNPNPNPNPILTPALTLTPTPTRDHLSPTLNASPNPRPLTLTLTLTLTITLILTLT